jgi:hypothetical protein
LTDNAHVTAVEAAIDELYARPLDDFTAARNALAKSLTGADRTRVSRLAKPTVVPWIVNQLYWHSRGIWQRLMESGAALRTAQVAALKGRAADIARLTAVHRKTLADLLKESGKYAKGSPDVNELSQMLEAISLGAASDEQPGRFTKAIRPAGLEALAGIVPVAMAPVSRRQEAERTRQAEAARQAQKEAAARLKAAETALERARATERELRERWERAQESVAAAERELAAARAQSR